MSITICDLPPELLSRIFELVRDPSTDYWLAQATLSAASLVHSSWTVSAQNELAYEVQFIRRPRQVKRSTLDSVRVLVERFAQPWLESSARKSGRCRKLTLPGRLVDARATEVLHACGGVRELSVEAWVKWTVLTCPALKDVKVLRLDASMDESVEGVQPLPFQLTHFIYHDTSDLTTSFLTSLFTSSLSTLTTLTLDFDYPGWREGVDEVLPLILPTVRHLNVIKSSLERADRALLRHCTSLLTLSVTGPRQPDVVEEAKRYLDVLPVKLKRLEYGWSEDLSYLGLDLYFAQELKGLLQHSALVDTKVEQVSPPPQRNWRLTEDSTTLTIPTLGERDDFEIGGS